jgi:hypothetical protein
MEIGGWRYLDVERLFDPRGGFGAAWYRIRRDACLAGVAAVAPSLVDWWNRARSPRGPIAARPVGVCAD